MASEPILGTYDLEKKVEDTLILLEATLKNYGDPNRAVIIEDAILQMIEAKVSAHPPDRYALLTFGETTETVMKFEDWGQKEFKERLYNNINILGARAHLVDGILAGFQELANSMMKLFEGKQFRMLIVTEGQIDHYENQQDWRELVDKCEKIGIFIDVVEITPRPHKNILRSITAGTKGEHIITKLEDVVPYMVSLASRKKITSMNQSEADKNMTAFLEIIAQPLDRLDSRIKSPIDLLNFVTTEDESTKCAICHSNTCMICKGPHYACGAYCPNCGRFFHEHCFAAWAENSKDTPPSIGKCPVCFALLKVPGAMYRVKVLQGRLKGRFEPKETKYRATKIKAKELGLNGAKIACQWCRNAFDAEEDIMQCGNPNCFAYYHFDCFGDMIKQTKGRCRVCDTKQGRSYDANPVLEKIA
ncbi:MAG: VWA domain-containing protein [Candidatus Lokiarchaeota archaeon]|nr:VWA domain-containing protein [Candidatus Lokiarchaeota archaeon]